MPVAFDFLGEEAPRRQFPLSERDSPLQHLRLRYFRAQKAGWTWAKHLAAHGEMRCGVVCF